MLALHPRTWAVALLLPVALVAGAQSDSVARLTIAPESRLWVEGTSTVRSYTCYATTVEGTIDYQGELGQTLETAGRAVNVVEIQVPVSALDCKNGTMNDHLRKALKAGESPVIRYRMTSHEVAQRADGGLTVTLTGTLALAGQEKEITMTADAVQDSSGRYRITGSHELRMKEFGVKPPTLMLGTLKVHDKVVVRYDIRLATAAAAVAAAR
jgi:polyisoprenoid-binding protein YceI